MTTLNASRFLSLKKRGIRQQNVFQTYKNSTFGNRKQYYIQLSVFPAGYGENILMKSEIRFAFEAHLAWMQ